MKEMQMWNSRHLLNWNRSRFWEPCHSPSLTSITRANTDWVLIRRWAVSVYGQDLTSSSEEARELGVFISILEVIGLEEVREIAQGLKAPLWQSWDLNAGLTIPRVKILTRKDMLTLGSQRRVKPSSREIQLRQFSVCGTYMADLSL